VGVLLPRGQHNLLWGREAVHRKFLSATGRMTTWSHPDGAVSGDDVSRDSSACGSAGLDAIS